MRKIIILFIVIQFNVFGQTEKKVFNSIEDANQNPEIVYDLNLSGQNLSEIPLNLLKFKNLKKLDLSSNNISILQKKIKLPENLELLNFSNNQLTEFSIFPLKKLKVLNLQKNKLVHIDENIGEFEGLIQYY